MAEQLKKYIKIDSVLKKGFVVPSIRDHYDDNTIETSIQNRMKGSNWMKDVLLEDNPKLPTKGDGITIRISKYLYLMYPKNGEREKILVRFDSQGNELTYAPVQLYNPTLEGDQSKHFDFVEEGFFSEPAGDDDLLYSSLKEWAQHHTHQETGIAMYSLPYCRINFFIRWMNKSIRYLLIPDIRVFRSKIPRKTFWIDSFVSLWEYKHSYEMNEEVKIPTLLSGGRRTFFLNPDNPMDGFIIFCPEEIGKGYVAFDGTLRINIYEQDTELPSWVVNFPDPREKYRIAHKLLMEELDWVNKYIAGTEGNAYKWFASLKGALEDAKSLTDLLVIDITGDQDLIFGPLPSLTEDELTYRTSVTDLLDQSNGCYDNKWVLGEIKLPLTGDSIFPVPQGIICTLEENDSHVGPFTVKQEFSPTSLYAKYYKYMGRVEYQISIPDSMVLLSPLVSVRDEDTGWLKEGLDLCPLYYRGVDLRKIGNLPNVTEKNLEEGQFMYHQEYELDSERVLVRDVWYADKETTDLDWSIEWSKDILYSDYDDGKYDDEPGWSIQGLDVVLELVKESKIDLMRLPMLDTVLAYSKAKSGSKLTEEELNLLPFIDGYPGTSPEIEETTGEYVTQAINYLVNPKTSDRKKLFLMKFFDYVVGESKWVPKTNDPDSITWDQLKNAIPFSEDTAAE